MLNKGARTYKVVNLSAGGGAINHVKRASNERDTDSVHERSFKRYEEAIAKRNRWIETEFHDADLRVTEHPE